MASATPLVAEGATAHPGVAACWGGQLRPSNKAGGPDPLEIRLRRIGKRQLHQVSSNSELCKAESGHGSCGDAPSVPWGRFPDPPSLTS